MELDHDLGNTRSGFLNAVLTGSRCSPSAFALVGILIAFLVSPAFSADAEEVEVEEVEVEEGNFAASMADSAISAGLRRHMRASILRGTGTGHRAGDKYFAIGLQGHGYIRCNDGLTPYPNGPALHPPQSPARAVRQSTSSPAQPSSRPSSPPSSRHAVITLLKALAPGA
jgi:hypothetical protein